MPTAIRHDARNRQTGTRVLLVDSHHADSIVGPDDGGRWATICELHGTLVYHRTLALARAHAADPLGWCGVCQIRRDAETSDYRCWVCGLAAFRLDPSGRCEWCR